jgi:hypothetical protein
MGLTDNEMARILPGPPSQNPLDFSADVLKRDAIVRAFQVIYKHPFSVRSLML